MGTKKKALLAAVLIAAPIVANASTINYSAVDVSGTTWQYNYSITNSTQPSNIGEFTILFTLGQYSNLSVEASPGNWSSIVAQPDPVLPANGSFDTQALDLGLPPGGSQGGFSVRFTWLGQGTPGAQTFNIVDPDTFSTLEAGSTIPMSPVPIPAAAWLMLSSLGGLGVFARKKQKAA